jgi:hypothetical protein
MLSLVFVLITILSIYVACKYPAWFWTVFVGGSSFLFVFCQAQAIDVDRIPLGPISARATDPGILAAVIGSFYHARAKETRIFLSSSMGKIAAVILCFVLLKIMYSLLFLGDQIPASLSQSHVAWGLVAVLGDVRDNLLPFFPMFFALASAKSRDLKSLGGPVLGIVCILLLQSVCGVLITGTIWAGPGDAAVHFIPADAAITLTLFSLFLFFLRLDRISRGVTQTIAILGLMVATIANHRSQWVGLAAGLFILGTIATFGRPLTKRNNVLPAVLTGAALLALLVTAAISLFKVRSASTPIFDVIEVRLYAVTNPSRDPDAEWRQKLWQDRIEQVGDDWPWGRPFGLRHETLLRGHWVDVPDHNGYVETYEMGGALLSLLMLFFWGDGVRVSTRRLMRNDRPEYLWPAALCVSSVATCLAYSVAYTFPYVGLALIVILTLGNTQADGQTVRSSSRQYGDGSLISNSTA